MYGRTHPHYGSIIFNFEFRRVCFTVDSRHQHHRLQRINLPQTTPLLERVLPVRKACGRTGALSVTCWDNSTSCICVLLYITLLCYHNAMAKSKQI